MTLPEHNGINSVVRGRIARVAVASASTLFLLGGCSAPVTNDAGVDAATQDSAPADVVTDSGPPTVALLGSGTHTLPAGRIRVISTEADQLNQPSDVAFSPEAPDQLWVTNHGSHSMTIFVGPGTPAQTSDFRQGSGSDHFMSKPSALAFGQPGILATAQDENHITQPTTPAGFMGPSMFQSDYDHFNGGLASHLDMLHNSPLSAGIAWDHANVYWVFDGTHHSITRYDFHHDHGPGQQDHSDGEVARFVSGEVGYVADVSSHLDLDHETGLLYIADTGNGRIATLDTHAGTRGSNMGPNYDGDVQYMMNGAATTTLIDGAAIGLQHPSGLELHGQMIFVSDNATSKIYAFDRNGQLLDWLDLSATVMPGGLMGLTLDASGNLFVVDNVGNQVIEVVAPAN